MALSAARQSPDAEPPAGPRVAVIDIGSNSVRLVVFDAVKRAPLPLFNEKVLCGLGRSLPKHGEMDAESIERAVAAVRRFALLARDMEVGRTIAVATAAVRDAGNGPAFVRQLEAETGLQIRTLSGAEEAQFSAEGVLSGCPRADGLMGDLGGGSLELVLLRDGKVGPVVTLPLGPLRLTEVRARGRLAAHAHIDDALAGTPWLAEGAGRDLYIVGGAWRALGRIHMYQAGYPLKVLHGYAVRSAEMEVEADVIAGLGKQSLKRIQGVTKERLDTLPLAALTLLRLLRLVRPKRIFFSSCGLREGLVHDMLPPAVRETDPLIAACREVCRRRARSPGLADGLADWLAPLAGEETPADARIRLATALLSDIGWRVHPDYRAEQSMQEVLRAQLLGIDHAERVQLALAIYARYTGKLGSPEQRRLRALLPEPMARLARQRGLALRLAHTLSGGAPGVLPHARLALDRKELTLSLTGPAQTLMGEVVARRFETLARACGCQPRIVATGAAAAAPAAAATDPSKRS
jgi:exopolyphosphatase/guanosine-5'-triphosphate,3'-diphosphate pyrophosphatase